MPRNRSNRTYRITCAPGGALAGRLLLSHNRAPIGEYSGQQRVGFAFSFGGCGGRRISRVRYDERSYPHRGRHSDPRKPAQKEVEAAVKRGIDPATIIAAAAAYREAVGREAMEERLGFVAHSLEALIEKLQRFLLGGKERTQCFYD